MKSRNFETRLWISKLCIYCDSYLFIFLLFVHFYISFIFRFPYNFRYWWLSLLILLCLMTLYIYGIHYWQILWSSYRKLAWLGFEPTTFERHSTEPTELSGHEFNSHSELTLYSYSSFIFENLGRVF